MKFQLARIILIFLAYLMVCALGYLGYATYRANLVGWYLILVAIAYGLGGPYLIRTNLGKKTGIVRQERKDFSFWLVLPGFLAVYYAPPLEYIFLTMILPRTLWMQIWGLVLLAASLLVFAWARLSLKNLYSGHVRVEAGHTLIQRGPYRYLRHPAYFAYLLMGLGLTVGFSSLAGLFSVLLLLLPGLIYRIRVEEKILLAEFGEQYIQYSRTTHCLVPGIW